MSENLRYILGDTETSGLDADAGVVEIAWIELDGDMNVIERVTSLIDPECKISPEAQGTHRISQAMVADAPTISEFFTIIRDGPIEGPSVLIAHNVAFDKRFFSPWMPDKVADLCTLRLARRYFPEVANHKLSTLIYALGLSDAASHRAADDVETTLDLLKLIVDVSGLTLPELAAESMQPMIVENMPFGKHKGVKVRDLPRTYISWLLKLDNLDGDLRYTLNQL